MTTATTEIRITATADYDTAALAHTLEASVLADAPSSDGRYIRLEVEQDTLGYAEELLDGDEGVLAYHVAS